MAYIDISTLSLTSRRNGFSLGDFGSIVYGFVQILSVAIAFGHFLRVSTEKNTILGIT
jgi:hypothetical protein